MVSPFNLLHHHHHRKLLTDANPPTDGNTTAVICDIECNPERSPAGVCLPNCTTFCPNWCPKLYSSPPPPPPPLAPTPLPPPPCSPTSDTSVPSTPSLKPHHLSLTLPLKISLAVLLVICSLFLIYTLYKFYTVWYRSWRRRTQPPEENQENHDDDFVDHDVLDHPIWYIRTIGLQPSVISAISVVKYKKGDGLVEGTDCSVCLSEFREDEMLRLLPKCNHAFHIPCIDTWLRSHTNCPLCRAGIVSNTANSPSPEQNVDDSGLTGETHVAISVLEEDRGGEMGEDGEGTELRLGVVEEEEESDVADQTEVVVVGGKSDFLMRRRSVSMDVLAGSRIRSDITNNSSDHGGNSGFEFVKDEQFTDLDNNNDDAPKREYECNQNQSFLRLGGGSSIGRSLQIGPSFMRRSVSCSGKVFPSTTG